jgi:hypothetical protein
MNLALTDHERDPSAWPGNSLLGAKMAPEFLDCFQKEFTLDGDRPGREGNIC